jgi:hypothetical protein
MFRDLQEGVLSEFAERATQIEPKLLHGYHVVTATQDRTLPSGAEYRALKLCPDCGKAPEAKSLRCKVCAVNHAAKCRVYRNQKKAA